MNQTIIDLLKKERVCVMSVIMADGMPHSAVVHFSADVSTDGVKLFIQTYPTLKTQAIVENGGVAKCAVVVGMSEQDFVTLQMHGEVRIITDQNQLEEIYKIHYQKLPASEKYKDDETIFLEFILTWWRYTDFKTSPETIISD